MAARTVEKDEIPDTDTIVVARSKGEIKIRRLRRINERQIKLSPETTDATHGEEVLAPEMNEVRIEGVMVGALNTDEVERTLLMAERVLETYNKLLE